MSLSMLKLLKKPYQVVALVTLLRSSMRDIKRSGFVTLFKKNCRFGSFSLGDEIT